MSYGSCGVKHFFAFIGRVFFAFYFLVYGVFNALNFSAIVQSYSAFTYVEGVLVALIVLQLLGGLLLLVGWFNRFAAFLVFIAIALMTWLEFLVVPVHVTSITDTMATFIHFVDNLGLAGAALYFMAFGAGAISFDYFRGRSKSRFKD